MLRCARRASGRRKLGLIVSTAPDRPNREPALGLSKAALDGGGDVYLYLIGDAVAAVEDARLQALADRGLKLFVCAYGCQKRRLPLSDRATNCGLVDLTDVINGTERFVALN